MDFDWWWDVRTANHTLGYKSIVLSKLWRVTRSSPYIYWISEEIQSMSRDLKWAFRKQSCLHLPWYNSHKEFREEFEQQGSSVSGNFNQQFELWWKMCWVFTSTVPSKTIRRVEDWSVKQLHYLSKYKKELPFFTPGSKFHWLTDLEGTGPWNTPEKNITVTATQQLEGSAFVLLFLIGGENMQVGEVRPAESRDFDRLLALAHDDKTQGCEWTLAAKKSHCSVYTSQNEACSFKMVKVRTCVFKSSILLFFIRCQNYFLG